MLSYVLIEKPTAMAVTRDEAIKQCRVVDSADYEYLDGLILKATRKVERDLQRQLITAKYRLLLDFFPDHEIEVRRPPVQSIDQITYIDEDGVTQTLTSDDYQASIRGPDSPARIRPAAESCWPSTATDTYDCVAIEFTAGYAPDAGSEDLAQNVPETIKHAILFLVAHFFENREPVSGNTVNAVPMTYDALLASEAWGAYA